MLDVKHSRYAVLLAVLLMTGCYERKDVEDIKEDDSVHLDWQISRVYDSSTNKEQEQEQEQEQELDEISFYFKVEIKVGSLYVDANHNDGLLLHLDDQQIDLGKYNFSELYDDYVYYEVAIDDADDFEHVEITLKTPEKTFRSKLKLPERFTVENSATAESYDPILDDIHLTWDSELPFATVKGKLHYQYDQGVVGCEREEFSDAIESGNAYSIMMEDLHTGCDIKDLYTESIRTSISLGGGDTLTPQINDFEYYIIDFKQGYNWTRNIPMD
ncbi:hypothetical protein [Thalassotalea sp. Y01]|uniref:hypothetical protein n=1 Tax=Thalassotalea sp. Y01 TaxID=2729613 RepID=UPI00145D18A7|nr:hypothetical protein [Thalassotalea sp. Y01]NMP17378.1 hypothetical protein [Thalassotalea sp. Y01]